MTDKNEKIESSCSKHNAGDNMGKARIAKLAEDGFGSGASNYDKNRPNYTKQAVDFVVKEIVSATSTNCSSLKYNVLEVGAGTGKLTEDLVPRLPENSKYLATEPSKDFLSFLESKQLPLETSQAVASDLPLSDSSVQNIVCAQCFHWFSNVESLQELHRVLVPGGKLILIWNANKFDEGWPLEVSNQRFEVMAKHGASTDNWFNTMQWQKAIDSSPLFSLHCYKSLPGVEFNCTLDQFLQNLSTVSSYNALCESERREYFDRLRSAILAFPEVNPDDMSVPYSSEIYIYTSQEKK